MVMKASWCGAADVRTIPRILYSFYERRLLREIKRQPVPRHVGIILDGNRRHGRSIGVSDPQLIYELGARKLDDVLDWCAQLKISAVTLWVLSTENLGRRPAEEISGIFAAIERKLASLANDPQIHRRCVRVRAIGDLALVPERTLAVIRGTEEATRSYSSMDLSIAVAYGGRREIVAAVKSSLREMAAQGLDLSAAVERLTPDLIGKHLYTAELPDPDLIIRTSGEIRLSGFLLWQSVRSEFYFTDVNWPAFRFVDFLRAIRAYQGRQRRFGM
jgi:short-chain Z-isoprenyl diphosphate synthase